MIFYALLLNDQTRQAVHVQFNSLSSSKSLYIYGIFDSVITKIWATIFHNLYCNIYFTQDSYRSCILHMYFFRPNVYGMIGPLKIFSYYLDLLKDSFLAAELLSIVGGIGVIEKSYTEFRSTVSYLFV